MDKLVKRMGILIPILFLSIACNKGPAEESVNPYRIIPTSITFPTIGSTAVVHLFYYDTEVTDFTLESEDPNIVAIQGHQITAKNPGETFVMVKRGQFSSRIAVRVIPGLTLNTIYVTPPGLTVTSWGTYSLSVSGIDDSGNIFYHLAASYETANVEIAEADTSGKITIGVKNGSTTITASCCGCVTEATINVQLPVSPPYGARVVSYSIGVSGGYGENFLPGNVLGPPRGGSVAQSSATQLLSLGNGGRITIEFADYVTDGPGVDFIVFENPLVSGDTVFTETAFVDVSQDGEHFIRFPARFIADGPGGTGNPDNYINLAGVHPVYANPPTTSATDPKVAGGDQFDLKDVGLRWIRFVRIVDTGYNSKDTEGVIIDDAGNHFPCAPDKCGFDLDAVSIVHAGHQVPPGR